MPRSAPAEGERRPLRVEPRPEWAHWDAALTLMRLLRTQGRPGRPLYGSWSQTRRCLSGSDRVGSAEEPQQGTFLSDTPARMLACRAARQGRPIGRGQRLTGPGRQRLPTTECTELPCAWERERIRGGGRA